MESRGDDYWIDGGGAVESFQPFLGIRQGWMMCAADKRKPIHLSDKPFMIRFIQLSHPMTLYNLFGIIR